MSKRLDNVVLRALLALQAKLVRTSPDFGGILALKDAADRAMYRMKTSAVLTLVQNSWQLEYSRKCTVGVWTF